MDKSIKSLPGESVAANAVKKNSELYIILKIQRSNRLRAQKINNLTRKIEKKRKKKTSQ